MSSRSSIFSFDDNSIYTNFRLYLMFSGGTYRCGFGDFLRYSVLLLHLIIMRLQYNN